MPAGRTPERPQSTGQPGLEQLARAHEGGLMLHQQAGVCMASLPIRVSTRALRRLCDAGREEAEAAAGAWGTLCTRVLLLTLALLALGV